MDIKISHAYDDIIDLPHHQSKTRPHMALADRAAQFSPFAALTGYAEEVKEAARLTEEKVELSEEMKSRLNEKFQILAENIKEHPQVTITYFLPDGKKAGGSYVTVTGNIKRIDEYGRQLMLTDGLRIPVDDVADIL